MSVHPGGIIFGCAPLTDVVLLAVRQFVVKDIIINPLKSHDKPCIIDFSHLLLEVIWPCHLRPVNCGIGPTLSC